MFDLSRFLEDFRDRFRSHLALFEELSDLRRKLESRDRRITELYLELFGKREYESRWPALAVQETSSEWSPSYAEVQRFVMGSSHALALQLHRATGLPIAAIVNNDGDPVHLMVMAPGNNREVLELSHNTKFLDILGVHTFGDICAAVEGAGIDCLDWANVMYVAPDWIKEATKSGKLPAILPSQRNQAKKIVARMVTAGLIPAPAPVDEKVA